MNKSKLIALVSLLCFVAVDVFADKQVDANVSEAHVKSIIAKIQKATEASKEEAQTPEVKVEIKAESPKETKTEIIKDEPATVKEKEPIKPASIEVKVEKETKEVELVEKEKVQEEEGYISLPSVPQPPKAIRVSQPLVDESGEVICDRLDKLCPPRDKPFFTKRVAPKRFKKKKEESKKEALPGDIKNARVAAYLHSPLMDATIVKKKLEKAGFEVLSKFKVDKKGKVISVVYTSDELKKLAAQEMRGFVGTLRVLVDEENKLVNISNPIYVLKAFMQEEYNADVAQSTLSKLRAVFPTLQESEDVVKFASLEKYHFMENMPYYQDMKVVKEGKNAELLKMAQKSKKVVYEQTLENGSIIIGVKLGKRTSKFVKKIGYENAGLLPYPVLIENGKAKILAPQYYIAVMYPRLKMSKFMTIATVPGAITKDIDKIFR